MHLGIFLPNLGIFSMLPRQFWKSPLVTLAAVTCTNGWA